MVKTPVLFETFVRSDYARQVWEAIKAAQPSKLYFYSNKGRAENESEIKRNNEIRSWINEIDWDCELHTWFREECVDVYTSLRGAITWLFENEEEGIILEDDCLPVPAFFEYCDYFLDLYKDEKLINFISGNNYVENFDTRGYDHIISRTFYHYGWATWRDRWESVDFQFEVEDLKRNHCIKKYFSDNWKLAFYYQNLFDNVASFIHNTHCWDYQKVICQIRDGSYCVTPVTNLVQNIGIHGVHVKKGKGAQFEKITGNNDHYVFTERKLILVPNCDYEIQDGKKMNKTKLSNIIKKCIKTIIKKKK